MPTPINQIYLSNTFTQWVSTTQSIVNRLTEIEYGSNSAQQLTIVGSGTRLSVANDSIFGTANVSGYFGVGGNTVISQNITVSGSNSTISGVNITANKIQLSSGSSVVSVYRGALANSAQIKWDESLKYWRLNDINTNNFYNIITSNNTATTTTSGVVQLYDGIGSSSTILAATANSISTVYNSISTVISPTLTLAYNQANSAYNQANAAYNQANSAYNQANSGITLTGISFDQANAAFNAANNAGSPAQITAAYNQANAAFFAANTANTRAANANNLTSGTISSSILGRSTLYIGTTGIALNRTSGSLVLNGITSIDGTATNITDYPITQNVSSNATTVRFASLGIGTNASGVTGEIRATNNITAYYSSDSK
jgi:hypothetical protein